ncbi:MAG: YdaU family protein [Mesoflavibacter sp.]|nr:YdaU family protein [Mesoflavibacter sp.]
MLYFTVHISDFSRKIMHLTDAQKGVIVSLALTYFEEEKPIPEDYKKFARISGIKDLKALDEVMELFFNFDEETKTYDCDFLKEALLTQQKKRDKKKQLSESRAKNRLGKTKKNKTTTKNNSSSPTVNSKQLTVNIKPFKKENKKSTMKFSNEHFVLAEKTQSAIAKSSPLAGKKFNLDKSANEFRLITERDGVGLDHLNELLKFAFGKQSWWRDKVTTVAYFRKHLATIESQMLNSQQPSKTQSQNNTASRILDVADHKSTPEQPL